MASPVAPSALRRRIAAHLMPIDSNRDLYARWPAPPALTNVSTAGLRPAAVLVPIIDHPGDPTVLLTIRTDSLQHHPGQVSFPGGLAEAPDADPVATALRESEEELGLAREAVTVLGYLDTHCTATGFCITPVVGMLAPTMNLRPAPLEVAEVFEVPLNFLLNPANRTKKAVEYDGRARSYFVYHYGERVIWGATARIVVNMCLKLQSDQQAECVPAAARKNCELE